MENTFNFWDANITDWIQAIATFLAVFFAIVATIIAVLDYRKRNKYQQQQINDVVEFTRHLKEQNELTSKLYQLETNKWKTSIIPIPIFNNEGVGATEPDKMLVTLRNKGGTATIIEVYNESDAPINIKTIPHENNSINKNETLFFYRKI